MSVCSRTGLLAITSYAVCETGRGSHPRPMATGLHALLAPRSLRRRAWRIAMNAPDARSCEASREAERHRCTKATRPAGNRRPAKSEHACPLPTAAADPYRPIGNRNRLAAGCAALSGERIAPGGWQPRTARHAFGCLRPRDFEVDLREADGCKSSHFTDAVKQ